MTIRYFNLKEGRRDVLGGIIKVDTSASDLEKLTDFDGDFASTPWKFKLLRREGKNEIYEMLIPNEEIIMGQGQDALGGKIGVPVSVSKGLPRTLKLRLTSQGEIQLYDSNKRNIYLTEMNEEEAKDVRKSGENWALQRAYIFE